MKRRNKKISVRAHSSSSAKKPVRKPRLGDMTAMPGKRQAIFVRGMDASGKSSEHFRIVDTLGTMLRKGTITVAMHDAAILFGSDFHSAGLLGMQSIDYASAGGGTAGASSTERAALASCRVHKALGAVGGIASLGGAFLWRMVGEGMQMREWAATTHWNNRSLSKDEARGIAIGALQMLATHYGYQSRPDNRAGEQALLRITAKD